MVQKKTIIPATFTVPATIGEVVNLLTARGWERAAIIYAFTKPDKGGGSVAANAATDDDDDAIPTEFPCSCRAFARIGISGLSDRNAVMRYRNRWQDAMKKKKAHAVKPGDVITVPDLPWPPTGHDDPKTEHDEAYQAEAEKAGVSVTASKRIGVNLAAVKAAIKADPKVAQIAEEALHEKAVDAIDMADVYAPHGGKPPAHKHKDPVKDPLIELAEASEGAVMIQQTALEILTLVRGAKERMDTLVAKYGYVGDPIIVKNFDEISDIAIGISSAIMTFTVHAGQEA